jgi:drug/metabolite transporter (DMT)-like permease
LVTSLIWGLAFVAQRAGMEHLGPFLFNAIRFALGSLWLLPFIYWRQNGLPFFWNFFKNQSLRNGFLLGIILFSAATFQQIGIVYTTAGKAGFITGLYVILVPLFGIMLKKTTSLLTWISAGLALIGLFFLSVQNNFMLARGDLLVLIAAFFWAFHVLAVDHLLGKTTALLLAFYQFLFCSLFSFILALFYEEMAWSNIAPAAIPILYAGLFSVGIGYTLQVFAQKEAHPSHAAIILSLEAVFAVIGGWILLHESLNGRELLGCLLMLSGMLLSQWRFKKNRNTSVAAEYF